MRVALCFSGLPRFVWQTFPYWKSCILDRYKPDVFVHTWRTDRLQTDQENRDVIQKLYNPVVFFHEQAPHIDVSLYRERIWPHRMEPKNYLSQCLGINRAQVLRRNWEEYHDFRYDFVIRARFDWYLKNLDLENNDTVNVAHTPTLSGHRFFYQNTPQIGINDQFAYGSSDVMHTYGNLIHNIPNLYVNYQIDFCGELFLKAHLLNNNIPHTEHQWHNGIVRDWGIMP
jgi:hypothetical protein